MPQPGAPVVSGGKSQLNVGEIVKFPEGYWQDVPDIAVVAKVTRVGKKLVTLLADCDGSTLRVDRLEIDEFISDGRMKVIQKSD